MLALSDRGQWDSAYTLVRNVEAIAPGDSLFRALTPRFAQRRSIVTKPAGARVWIKEYGAPDSAWSLLGVTPLDSVLLPLEQRRAPFSPSSRLRIEAPGYRRLDLVGAAFEDSVIPLDRDGCNSTRDGTRWAEATSPSSAPGFDRVQPVPLSDYLMDRFEVTNREYKGFVDSGGYHRQELWEQPVMNEGKAAHVAGGDGADGGSYRPPRALHLGGRRLSQGSGRLPGCWSQLV